MSFYRRLLNGDLFWAGLAVAILAMEGIALYYQYVLDYLPCVLCIHVRIWLAFLLIPVLFGWLVGTTTIRTIALVLMVGLQVVLVERSWQLLATERGWTLGDCNMELGFPNWLALDQWMPWMFEIHEPCGYTPYLLFEVTMAEGLLAFWGAALLLSLAVLLSAFGKRS